MADYSIRIVEYANVPNQTLDNTYSGFYGAHDETEYFPFSAILLSGEGHNILVECGIDFTTGRKIPMAEGFGLANCHSIQDVLPDIGCKPEDVDIIIVSHAHWDHMGALSAFPNATVYVQKEEIIDWLEIMSKPSTYAKIRPAIDEFDFHCIIDKAVQGKLVLVDGEVENILPGISIWVDHMSHSCASQIVLIENTKADGTVEKCLAAGDVIYNLDNLLGVEGAVPGFIPNTKWGVGGPYAAFKSYERILKYMEGENLNYIFFPHDKHAWSKHKSKLMPNGLHIAEARLAEGDKSIL